MTFKSYKPETSAFLELVFDGKLSEAEGVLLAHPEIAADRSEHVGESPLHYLSIEGQIEGVELMLRHGADPNTVDDFENSALIHAAMLGQVGAAEVLIEGGAATRYARPEFLETALHFAAGGRRNCDAMIDLLVAHGADVHAQDSLGSTPLHYAAVRRNVIAARCLIGHGADRSAADGIGRRPVDVLRESAPAELRELLLPRTVELPDR